MQQWTVEGTFTFYDDMVTVQEDGTMKYAFVITSDEEQDTNDIRRLIGEQGIYLRPIGTNGRLTKVSFDDDE